MSYGTINAVSASAEATSYNNASTSSIITSDNVQGAIDQLFQSVSEGKSLIAGALTDKGISTSASDSWQTIAGNISNYSGRIVAGIWEYNGTYGATAVIQNPNIINKPVTGFIMSLQSELRANLSSEFYLQKFIVSVHLPSNKVVTVEGYGTGENSSTLYSRSIKSANISDGQIRIEMSSNTGDFLGDFGNFKAYYQYIAWWA